MVFKIFNPTRCSIRLNYRMVDLVGSPCVIVAVIIGSVWVIVAAEGTLWVVLEVEGTLWVVVVVEASV